MADNEAISKAVAQHVLWRLDKEHERSENLEVSSTMAEPDIKKQISPAWAKIRSSVVQLPQNLGLRMRRHNRASMGTRAPVREPEIQKKRK